MVRDTTEVCGDILYLAVKANIKINRGIMVALEQGKVVPASKNEGLVVLGRAEEDTQGGFVNIKRGIFLYENDTDSPLSEINIMQDCYIKDSHTVTANAAETCIAGKVLGFEDGQVMVEIR